MPTSTQPATTRLNVSKLRKAGIATALSFFLMACGGGGNLAAEAEEKSAATCGCATFDCTTEYIMWFNRVSITQGEDLDALAPADLARYQAANSAAADCQNALR